MNQEIIANASYYVDAGFPKINSCISRIPGGITQGSDLVTFYTFDGNPIKTIICDRIDIKPDNMLDPNAPKPKPVSYRKIWWPAYRFGYGLLKSQPGYAVLYHDKSGNRIGWNRIKSPDVNIKEESKKDHNNIELFKKLRKTSSCVHQIDIDKMFPSAYDLSEAIEEAADYSLKSNNSESYCIII